MEWSGWDEWHRWNDWDDWGYWDIDERVDCLDTGKAEKTTNPHTKNKLLSNTHRHSCNTYEIVDNSIYKLQDVHLDLSAIAKGYAIDKASIYL